MINFALIGAGHYRKCMPKLSMRTQMLIKICIYVNSQLANEVANMSNAEVANI